MKILAGTSARVLFTHLSQRSCASLQEKLSSFSGPAASSQVYTQSILELLKNQDVPLSKVCLLDPKAERELEPEDGLEFKWFLFGARQFMISFLPTNPFLGNSRYSSFFAPRNATRESSYRVNHQAMIHLETVHRNSVNSDFRRVTLGPCR